MNPFRRLSPLSCLRIGLLSFCALVLSSLFSACTKQEIITIDNNQVPYYDEIPTLLVENYVNKIFIDLLGREPTDIEMQQEVEALQNAKLQRTAREALITKLQNDTTYVDGDISYKYAYCRQVYEMTKAHLIEGASSDEINEILGPIASSLVQYLAAGGTTADSFYIATHEVVQKLETLLEAGDDYREDSIDIFDLFEINIDNAVYDNINMNTFNYVNATFDNLFYRYPTDEEFYIAYEMIENSTTGQLFGQTGSSKDDYVAIVGKSIELSEGIIIWVYESLLARRPSTQETYDVLLDFHENHDFKGLQLRLMCTDEYANFD